MPDPVWTRLGASAVGVALVVTLSARAWAVEAKPDNPQAAAARSAPVPIVAGFERFAGEAGAEPVESGLLLLGELNCGSCHQAGPKLAAHLNLKQAPILDGVGTRVQPAYLRTFLADPHAVKPGTTMPDLFHGWDGAEKDRAIEALTHLLASTGGLPKARIDRKAVAAGKTLYEQVGCLACHGPRDGKASATGASVPLGVLEDKYTVPSLAVFLLDPLKVRPSGRMPGLRLKPEEASQVAQYLLKEDRRLIQPNLEYQYYEAQGTWDRMPDFSKLVPKTRGRSDGFDLTLTDRKANIGMRFEGFLRIGRPGQYAFILKSDDGSKLYVDDTLVVDNDGVHPAQDKKGTTQLEKGTHRLVVEFFNAGGEIALEADVEGPA